MYFDWGIEGAVIIWWFQTGVLCSISGNSQHFSFMLKMTISENWVKAFQPPKNTILPCLAKRNAECPDLGSG